MSNIIDSIQVSGVTYQLSGSSSGGNNVVELTQAEYDALVDKDPTAFYIITDAEEINANDYVTKTSNVVSGYTTYQLFDAPESPSFYNLTIDEILVRRCYKEGVNTETHTVYLKNSNNQTVSTSLSLNWTDKTGSTSQDISLSVTWSDSLDGFVMVDNNTSYPYFYNISPALPPHALNNYRYYYKVDDVQSQQSAAYLNGIDKGVEADYVVGFPNSTSLSSDGSLMIELLKEKSSISHNYKVCNTNDFDWGFDGISYKLVNGEGHYDTLSLDGIYCQVPQNSPSKYNDAYLSIKFKINPNYSSQDNNSIILYLGAASDKTQTYWSTSNTLTFYYNGSTDTIDTNGIVGTYDIYSINYDQTTHYVTIDMNIYQTYNGYYWAIKQVGHGSCLIGTNYQITEFQYYTTKYKPFDYLNDVKIDTSAITTSVTSSSTDSQVPSAKAVNDKLGGLSLVKLTQAEYDALVQGGTVDANTLYIITNVVN